MMDDCRLSTLDKEMADQHWSAFRRFWIQYLLFLAKMFWLSY